MNFLTGFLFSFLILFLSQGTQIQSSLQIMAVSFLAAVSTYVVVTTKPHNSGWLALFSIPPLLLINDALADWGLVINPIVLLAFVAAISMSFIDGLLEKSKNLALTALALIFAISLLAGWWSDFGLLVMLSVFGFAYFVNRLATGNLVGFLAKKWSFAVGLALFLFAALSISESFGFSIPTTFGVNQQQFSDSMFLDLIFKSGSTLAIVTSTALLFEIFAWTITEKGKESKNKTVNAVFMVISLILVLSISHVFQLFAPVNLGPFSLLTASLIGAATVWLFSQWLGELSKKINWKLIFQSNQLRVVAIVGVIAYLLAGIFIVSKTAESFISFEEPSVSKVNEETISRETPKQRFLIAHAGGGYEGKSYSNSINALEENKGNFDFFELDLRMTSDGHFVCIHDWDGSSERQLGQSFDEPPTLEEFRLINEVIELSQNCDEETLANWLMSNPDKKIVTDGKGDSERILERIVSDFPEIVPQVVPQVYFPAELSLARTAGYEEIILTLYKWMPGAADLSNFLNSSGEDLFALTFPKGSADTYTDVSHSFGIPACVHAVNDEDEAKQFFDSGINCFYTSFITSVP